jgi:uncharacterized protein
MFEEAKEAIKRSSPESTVYIGCDSIRYKRHGKWWARYSTVVVLHINSGNGCSLWHNSIILPDYGNLKQRLMTEVQHAIDCATEILEVIGKRPLSIHLDLNADPKHKSNVAVKEALGYVRGMTGLEAEIKPDAFAATYAADHAVRNLGFH